MALIYFYLLVVTLTGPAYLGRDPRVRFNQRWLEWLPGVLISALGFIAWDVWFTARGVWGFNPRYLIGINIFGLPIEEIAFFVIVPYACLFIQNVMKYYDTPKYLAKVASPATLALITALIALAIATDHAYPRVVAITTASLLAGAHYRKLSLPEIYAGYLMSLIPFAAVNGILTGTCLEAPIVWYDDAQTLGLRLGTIPAEDTLYALAMIVAANLFNKQNHSHSESV